MQLRVLAPSENLSLSCHWALLYLNSVTEQEKMAREAVLGKSHVIYTLSTERNSNSIDHKLGFIWPLLAESHFLASRKAFLSLESETWGSLLLFPWENSVIGPAGVWGPSSSIAERAPNTVSSLTVHMPCESRDYLYFSKLENRNRGSWYSPVLNAIQSIRKEIRTFPHIHPIKRGQGERELLWE